MTGSDELCNAISNRKSHSALRIQAVSKQKAGKPRRVIPTTMTAFLSPQGLKSLKRDRSESFNSPQTYSSAVCHGPLSDCSTWRSPSTLPPSSQKPRLPTCLIGSTPEVRDSSLKHTLTPLKETDKHRLQQRQKQVDYGKNTLGYDRYSQTISKDKRRPGIDPQTPNIHTKISKKRWDGLVRAWRRRLHNYDPDPPSDKENQVGRGNVTVGALFNSTAADIAGDGCGKKQPGQAVRFDAMADDDELGEASQQAEEEVNADQFIGNFDPQGTDAEESCVSEDELL